MKKTNFPKDSCSASTSSSMVEKTSSPKASSSSSSSVSRNPPATSNPRIAEDNRPTTTHDQSVASLASFNEGDILQLRGWSEGRVLKIHNNDPSLLDDIEPNSNDIVMVAELKLGSLYLRKILKDYPFYFNKIFNATLDFTYPLMVNPEGTYVLRKLYDLCDSNHLKLIVGMILLWPGLLQNAAKTNTGSGTLMKLIEVLRIDSTNLLLLKSILHALNSEFLSMMTSKYGSSLFRFFLKDLDPWQNKILYNTAATHCIDLVKNTSGYASLIALIENTPNPYIKVLLLKIVDNAVHLSQHPKGNYVIQATLLNYPELDRMICKKLVGTYLHLSTHKYATKVVQKCIISSGMDYPILELIHSGELHVLSEHQAGNYVVQKALTATKFKRRDLYDGLVGEIEPYLKDLQNHPIGRYVFRLI